MGVEEVRLPGRQTFLVGKCPFCSGAIQATEVSQYLGTQNHEEWFCECGCCPLAAGPFRSEDAVKEWYGGYYVG